MLHWQLSDLHKVVPRKIIFFAKLLLLSALAHLVLLTLLFFVYKGDLDIVQVIINTRISRSDAPVIFIPWIKRVHKTVPATTLSGVQKRRLRAKPVKKSKTFIAQPKVSKIKQKKTLHKTAAKQTKRKKKEQIHKVKAQEKKQAAKLKKLQAAVVKESDKKQKVNAAVQTHEQQYIGRYEKDALELHDAIKHEIMNYWKPPVGFTTDASCTMKFFVDWDGVAQNITISQSSGMVVIDLSARSAVEAATFPSMARGKEITLTLE